MRHLFEYIPPLRSDVFGFMDVLSRTNVYGLINDSSDYNNGTEYGGRHAARDYRIKVSRLRNEQTICGAADLLVSRAKDIAEKAPEYIFVAEGPAASMIGTDLDDVCRRIRRETGVGAKHVGINGHKTYDFGAAETLLCAAKCTSGGGVRRRGAVNILGGSTFDIGAENINAITELVRSAGFFPSVLTKGEKLPDFASAELSLVITAAGIPAAKYLKENFGVPYIAGLPIGKDNAENVINALKTGAAMPSRAPTAGGKKALIICEQFLANAMRDTLCGEYGFGTVIAASYLLMDDSFMQPGDRRLVSESELFELISSEKFDYIFADPMYKACWNNRGEWIKLPCKGFYCPTEKMPCLVGTMLNEWLDTELNGRR